MTIVDHYAAELRRACVLHEIVLTIAGRDLAVSCTCLASAGAHGGRPRHDVIEARTRFPAADAHAAWRAWHEQAGVIV